METAKWKLIKISSKPVPNLTQNSTFFLRQFGGNEENFMFFYAFE